MPIYKSKTKTKDGRMWYYSISVKDVNGKYKKVNSKKYLTKREAEKAESLYLINNGKKTPNDITFGEVIETMLKEKEKTSKPTTLRRLKQQLKHVQITLADVKVASMTIADYQRFRDHLDNLNLSVIYKNKIISLLKSVCKFSSVYYDVSTNIPDKFERYKDTTTVKKEMSFYTYDEYKQFISVIDDIRYIALFTVLFYCGLRIGEANALQWQDVDFNNCTLKVNKTCTTKMSNNGSQFLILSPKTKSSIRTLPLAKSPINALKTLYNYYSKFIGFNDQWFCFGGLKPLPESTIHKQKKKYVKLANVKNIRLHDFRHSCASLLINNGANITLVSQYLGHSNISMTLNIYSHFYKSKMEELITVLDDLDI